MAEFAAEYWTKDLVKRLRELFLQAADNGKGNWLVWRLTRAFEQIEKDIVNNPSEEARKNFLARNLRNFLKDEAEAEKKAKKKKVTAAVKPPTSGKKKKPRGKLRRT
jgi:hypothetical protein